MKFVSAIVFACVALAAVPAAAQAYGNYVAPGMPNTNPGFAPHGFSDARRPPSRSAPAPTFGYRPNPLYAPPSRQPAQPSGPARFKPYGDRSGMARGGPGAYPSAPKPKGYIDIYGNKPSEHPFAF